MLCHALTDVALITIKDIDDRCVNHGISKSETIHLLEN